MKQTFASVTDTVCSCNYLQDSANNPELPIFFDKEVNEYQFKYKSDEGGAEGMMVIYHCPFCGGAAPESIRGTLFAKITQKEEHRLNDMLKEIKTMEDALKLLGDPNADHSNGVTVESLEIDGEPSQRESYRSITYTNLSDTVDVYITDYLNKGIHITFQGKYLGNASG